MLYKVLKKSYLQLNKNGPAFAYLKTVFPHLSDAKIKEGIIVGPQRIKLLKDNNFDQHLSSVETDAWYSFKAVVTHFLGNTKTEDYEKKCIRCVNMSLKIHFLHFHLEFFFKTFGSVSYEHGEGFHQDLKSYKKRYQHFGIKIC